MNEVRRRKAKKNRKELGSDYEMQVRVLRLQCEYTQYTFTFPSNVEILNQRKSPLKEAPKNQPLQFVTKES